MSTYGSLCVYNWALGAASHAMYLIHRDNHHLLSHYFHHGKCFRLRTGIRELNHCAVYLCLIGRDYRSTAGTRQKNIACRKSDAVSNLCRACVPPDSHPLGSFILLSFAGLSARAAPHWCGFARPTRGSARFNAEGLRNEGLCGEGWSWRIARQAVRIGDRAARTLPLLAVERATHCQNWQSCCCLRH